MRLNLIEQLIKVMLNQGVKVAKEALGRTIWNSPSQKQKFMNSYHRLKKQEHMIIKNWEERIKRISVKMQQGKLLTWHEKQFLEIDKYRQKFNTWTPVHGTWIKWAKYDDKTEQLVLRMRLKVGHKDYTFFNVPYWVWAYLTTLNSGAGKEFWDKKFGILYSTNPRKWYKSIKIF